MKPKYSAVKFRNLTLTTAIVVCCNSNAFAADNYWNGATSTEWNVATNWSLAHVPTGDNTFVNTSGPNIATISTDSTATPVDIFVGLGAGNTGVLNHTGGIASTGNGNWMFVGRAGGMGTYNLGVSGGGGTFTGLGEGSGSMTVGGRLYIGGSDGTNSTGVVNVNTSGTLKVGTMVEIGTNTSTGTLNIDKGTMNSGTAGQDSWFEVGNGVGSTGVLNMSGGEINKTGNRHFIVGANGATGTVNLTGGKINVNNEIWVPNGANSNGTLKISGSGEIVNNSWVAVGRDGSTLGKVEQTGGKWTKTGAGTSFIVGANSVGVYLHSGGLMDVQAGDTWMGEKSTCTYTLSGTGEFRATYFQVARNATAVGNVNLNGGTLRVNQIAGGAGAENISFNGTQIVAKQNHANFIAGIDPAGATIDSGGLLINSAGFTLNVPQGLDGTGGVVKSGAGKLTLSAIDNSYSGDNSVLGGELALNTGSLGAGNITLANSTALGLMFDPSLTTKSSGNVTFGTGDTVNFSVGDLAGFNNSTPLLDVTGNLNLAGDVTVNLVGSKLQAANLPLLSYVAANRGGVGNFVLGTLPPGVVATLKQDANYQGSGKGMIYLDITSVALPEWNGTNETVLVATGDTTAASSVVTVSDATGILVGQSVRGEGIPAGAKVASIAGTTITLDMAATATATFVDLDFVKVAGTADGVWDTTTPNWIDQVSFLSTQYADPDPVLFSDLADGPTAVTLNITVTPSMVTFNNWVLDYSVSGSGKISGVTGLSKSGSAALTVSTINDYTGVTTLAGGRTTVTALTNGGVAGPLGAAAAAPANLVLAGGTLALSGVTPTTIDRGLTITGGSGLNLASDLTITGQILRTGGGISKSGPGVLKYTNAGPNGLGDMTINGGGVILDGSGGPQVNTAANIDVTTATGSSSLTLIGDTTLTTPNRVLTGLNAADAVGAIIISGTSKFNMTGGWLSIGHTGDGSLTVKDSGSFSMTPSDFNISDLNNSKGTLNLQDSGTINASTTYWGKNPGTIATINLSGGTYTSAGNLFVASSDGSSSTVTQTAGTVAANGDTIQIGRNGKAVWNQSGGTTNAIGWVLIGRDTMGDGTLNVSGGVFNQLQADRPLMVAEFGKGTLNVKTGGEVNSLGANGLIIANEPSGTGVVNLDGGVLTVRRVREGNDNNAGVGGSSTFHFNGGILKAGATANMDFMRGLDLARVDAGGAFIDTNGQTVAIGQVLDDGGGALTKQGAGTLLLNGANGYLGNTTVAAGALGGTGSLSGPLTVPTGSTVAPGVVVGTFTVGNAITIGGTYACDLDGANADKLAAFGPLTIGAGAVLDFNQIAAPTAPVYVIASFTSKTGTFVEQDVPSGYKVVYNATDISLVQASTPYDTWVSGYFPGETNPAIVGPTADPDSDGSSNVVEFALGGAPNSGSNNPKIYNFVADGSVDADAQKELLMTIAVRSGTPVFAGTPSPTATFEGITYTIQGSANLSSFPAGVTPVDPVTTGLPAAPAGYEYRSFSLDGSNGTPSKGFLRVQIK